MLALLRVIELVVNRWRDLQEDVFFLLADGSGETLRCRRLRFFRSGLVLRPGRILLWLRRGWTRLGLRFWIRIRRRSLPRLSRFRQRILHIGPHHQVRRKQVISRRGLLSECQRAEQDQRDYRD